MPNRNYQLGYAFERRVMKHLTDEGYLVVRSSGSHGKIDIVAIALDDVRLIQCKRHGKISAKERAELLALREQLPGCTIQLARMPGPTGIEFIDVSELL